MPARTWFVLWKYAVILTFATAMLLPPPATAGGWWTSIRVDRQTVAAGQQVNAHAQVMFSSVDAVEAAQEGRGKGAFYVYVLSGFDSSVVQRAMRRSSPRNWWSVGDATTINVGRVTFGSSETNLALANASFEVPELPPGTYVVMFCDHGCVRPLADVIPTELTVVTDPMIARIATRLDRLEQWAHTQVQQLLGASAEARKARLTTSGEQAQMRARIQTLDRRFPDERRSPWAGVRWMIAGLALGVVAGLLLLRRRLGGSALRADRRPTDGELGELLSGPPPTHTQRVP